MTWDFERYLDALPEEGEPEVRSRRPAPGKVSLTSSLRPAQGAVPFTSADDQKASYLSTPVQRKESGQHDDPFGWDSWAAPVNRGVQAVAADGVSAPGGRLPYIEQIQLSFGRHDVSGIEAHVGGRAAEASDAIGARAYATGNHVAFASAPDLHTAAHEAAHVVQQRGGVQLMGGVGEAGDRYERHADAVADKVVAGESAEALLDELAPRGRSAAARPAVQRVGMGDVRAAEAGLDRPDRADAGRTVVEGVFLAQLSAELLAQIPSPLRMEEGKPATVHIIPKSAMPLPAAAPIVPLYCKLLDADNAAVAEGAGQWHPTFVVGSTFTLRVPSMGARTIELHVNAGRPGARVLRRPLVITTPQAERAANRERAAAERETVKTKLIGLEDVYRMHRDQRAARSRVALADPEWRADFRALADEQGREVEALLKRHGFASTAEFEGYIKRFEQAFEREAVETTKEILQRYAARIAAEATRYKDPSQVATLHAGLASFRNQHQWFEHYAGISNSYLRDSEEARRPGHGHRQPRVSADEARQAHASAAEVKAYAESEIQGLAPHFPILDEEGLPQDRRIDKAALARADERQLGVLLRSTAARRAEDIAEALAQISGNPRLVYKMDKLMPQFYARQGITPGSIHDLILQDKRRDDDVRKLVAGIALAIVAIAVTVASAGAATPAVAAAGAAVGAGIGAYGAYTEYKEHEEQQDLADVGFADEPSTAWLVVAILGAGFDVSVALKSMKALAPAAKALHAGGDVAAFNEAVRALEKAHAIEARIARTAEKAAAAKQASSETFDALLNEWSKKVAAGPGALSDEKVRKLLVDLAVSKTKHGLYSAQMFIDELRIARARVRLGEMSPEELAHAKQAWEEALEEIGGRVRGAPDTPKRAADNTHSQAASGATASSREERLADLARDPDHAGKASPSSIAEAEAVMGLEDAGLIPTGSRRPPTRDGSDFHDPTGQKWDVKAPRSRTNLIHEIQEKARAKGKPAPELPTDRPIRGEFTVESTLKELRKEIEAGEKVIVDTRNMQPADVEALREAIATAGLEDHVKFFPP